MLKTYVKIAWRNLLHQKHYSLINVGSLTIAITAVLLIMIWVKNELRFDHFQPLADRIFLVTNREQTDITQSTLWEHSPYPLSNDFNSIGTGGHVKSRQDFTSGIKACIIYSTGILKRRGLSCCIYPFLLLNTFVSLNPGKYWPRIERWLNK